jgi:hypothetical protein
MAQIRYFGPSLKGIVLRASISPGCSQNFLTLYRTSCPLSWCFRFPLSSIDCYLVPRSICPNMEVPQHQHGIRNAPTLYAEGEGNFDQPRGLGFPDGDGMSVRQYITSKGVAKPMRLRKMTVMCMIFNRMIGILSLLLLREICLTLARNWHFPNTCHCLCIHRERWCQHAMVVSWSHGCYQRNPRIHGTWAHIVLISLWQRGHISATKWWRTCLCKLSDSSYNYIH